MSLLHRQIAAQMRLHPQRGGMPLAVVTHPLGILVSAVAGEMGSPPLQALQASVGALLYVTRGEMIERGRPVNNGIEDLDRDARAQFVYMDPVKARQSAADLRETAAHMPGSPIAGQFLTLAAKFEHDAAVNEARAKGRSPEQITKQVSFYTSFYNFKNQWDDFYTEIRFGSSTFFGGGQKFDALNTDLGNELPEKIDSFYAQYRKYYEDFIAAGGVPTLAPTVASNAGDTHISLPDIIKPVTDAASSILKPILYGGLVVGGVLLAASLYRPGPAAPAR